MTTDSDIVMERLGLGDAEFHHSNSTFQEQVISQIRTVTEFAYDTVVRRQSLRHCVTNEDLQLRLLRAFVFNGYLPPHVLETRLKVVSQSVTQLVNLMTQLFVTSRRSKDDVEKQKKKFLLNYFVLLPRDVLLKIRDYYKDDFAAFGYENEPPELFSNQDDKWGPVNFLR
jgi:hypothetical protein